MELAICKAELPTTKFMLPTTAPAAAAFFEKNNAHLNEILNFNANFLFNKNINNNNYNNNSVRSNNNNSSILSNNNSGSTMRLKKNRKVTFLQNLIETNVFIKEEPDDGGKDIPPPICSLSDISDHEASIDVPTQIPPLTPGTNRKVAEVLKASFASWEKEVQNCNITKDPREWTEEHVIYWLNWAIKEFSLVSMNLEPFIKMKGRDMIELGKDKFLAITPAFTGDILWEHLDILQKDCEKNGAEDIGNNQNNYEAATTGSVCGSDHQVGNYLGNSNNNSSNSNSNNNNNNRSAPDYTTPPASDKSSFHSPSVHHSGDARIRRVASHQRQHANASNNLLQQQQQHQQQQHHHYHIPQSAQPYPRLLICLCRHKIAKAFIWTVAAMALAPAAVVDLILIYDTEEYIVY